jgi:nicotinamide-nucleotide adenylyltransferase
MTKTLFKEARYKIRGIPFLDKQHYSGTEIRKRISLGEKWQDLVPSGTLDVIEQIAGEERIKSLCT